jgi:hypothetical protein
LSRQQPRKVKWPGGPFESRKSLTILVRPNIWEWSDHLSDDRHSQMEHRPTKVAIRRPNSIAEVTINPRLSGTLMLSICTGTASRVVRDLAQKSEEAGPRAAIRYPKDSHRPVHFSVGPLVSSKDGDQVFGLPGHNSGRCCSKVFHVRAEISEPGRGSLPNRRDRGVDRDRSRNCRNRRTKGLVYPFLSDPRR